MKQTQEQWVIAKLKEQGYITRNQALQNFISRLGAIICDLNKSGWNIHGDWVKTDHGRDYKYTLIEAKKRVVYEYELRDGVRVPMKTYVTA